MVWFLNGLVCKVLNLVPRHQEIVARILGDEYARTITVLIGISEIMMAVWVLSKYKSKFNAVVQMVIVLTMNLLEYYIAPDLLFWGRMNIVFALFFIGLVYYNEFILKEHS
ncbi:DoxX-like family protein [Maribacter spongiicola]|uniref:DoxX-like family protein n=1 Tax=Maribacter spongiicola TaxID=1206753 RepID=UPI00105B4901|nr:DoxX-like family protein [Maribacter spongiicola]